jgi:hypothetical protein
MIRKNILKIALIIFLAITANHSYGQTILYNQGFETDLQGYTHTPSQVPADDPGRQYFYRAEPSDTNIYERSSDGPYTNVTGSWLFVGSNPNTISGIGILSSGLIDVTGYENFELSIDFGAVPTDWDATDNLSVEYSRNNTDWSVLYNFAASGTNLPLDLVNNASGGSNTVNGATLTYALQTIVSNNFTGFGNSLYLRIVADSNSNYEAFALDNIILTGLLSSSSPRIGFDSATSAITETDATFNVLIPVTASNYDANQIDISVVVTGGTAEITDYTLNTTALSFSANGSQYISLDIHDDADLEDETIILTITETSAVTGLVLLQSTHTITITDNEIPTSLVEDFTNSNATASYNDNSFVGNNDITWTFVSSRDEDGDANVAGIDGKALMLRNLANNSKVTSSIISGGIGNFSVKLYKGFTGSGVRQVQLFINGVSKGTSIAFDDADDKDAYLFEVDNINVAGSVTIEIINTKSTQVIVDDITWTSYGSATVTWNGSSSSDWSTTGNWDTNTIPTASDNVIIPDVVTAPIISASTTATTNNLTITEPDGINITSGGSLIVNGTSSGNVTYNRIVDFIAGNTNGWYLVSSPISGETYNNAFANANDLATSGTKRGLATYNDAGALGSKWTYLEENDSNAGSFTSGFGYSVKRASTGSISFTGTINTADIPVTVTTSGKGHNLVGNPFTSFVNTATFLTENTGSLVSETIWLWNQGTGNYETQVTANSFMLAPAQGFFVKANANTNLNFAKTNQTTSTDTFQKSSKTEVHVIMTDGTNERFAKIYYLENASKGFDNGYDGETFGGIANSMDVFTQLLIDNEGKNYQIQSLPNSDYEKMVVPVGVIALSGKELSFSVETLNLPSDLKVFLEDRQLNKFSRLDELDSSYKVTLSEALNGIGRFYLHTSPSATLRLNSVALENLSIYKTSRNNLRIVGVSQGKSNVKMFNVLGKQVLNSSFNVVGVQDIKIPKLASGIYIVQLETESGKLNKKITLE